MDRVPVLKTIPQLAPVASPAELVTQLVEANHVLVDQGILDAFGHVSVRSPASRDAFLISRSLAPALVQEEEIQLVSLDGETGDARSSYLEVFIHAEIYRARPEVMAVVHSHSPAVIPFGASAVPLQPILHMAGFLAPAVPVFEIRDVFGTATDLLIRSPAAGAALAESLGESSVVLMRGHGATMVGRSLPEAVYRAVYTEVNARAQIAAANLGSNTFLTDAEAHATVESTTPQIIRAWNYWKARVRSQEREGC